jgi:endogenous inhibitor of DNA gyrase (YacG/DUF329 family)
MKATALVTCPTCKKKGRWFEGAFGAFCSHRCKLIDLGKWLGEEHAISEPLPPDSVLDRPSGNSPSGEEPEI